MADPVQIIENAIADRWLRENLQSDSDPEVDARTALAALHAAGWSIVRIESAGLWEDPRFRGPYNEDERRPIDAYELFSIAEEWTP